MKMHYRENETDKNTLCGIYLGQEWNWESRIAETTSEVTCRRCLNHGVMHTIKNLERLRALTEITSGSLMFSHTSPESWNVDSLTYNTTSGVLILEEGPGWIFVPRIDFLEADTMRWIADVIDSLNIQCM